MDYPLLNFIVTGCWMAVLAGVFIAFGWCDPREYQRKIGLDIFSGVMAFIALRVGSHVKAIVAATVEPRTDGALFNFDSILQFATGYYEQLTFESIFDKVDNQLMALILIGISIMLVIAVAVLSVVFGIYFVFRMCVLADIFINNLIRYVVMGAALIITLFVGISSHQTSIMLITLLLGIVSIIKLAIGNVLLKYYGENFSFKKKAAPQAAHSRSGAPSGRPAAQGAGRPASDRPMPPQGGARQRSPRPQAPQDSRPMPPQGARPAQPQGTRPISQQGLPRQNPNAQRPAAPAAPAAPRTPQNPSATGTAYSNNPPTRTRPAPKPSMFMGDDE